MNNHGFSQGNADVRGKEKSMKSIIDYKNDNGRNNTDHKPNYPRNPFFPAGIRSAFILLFLSFATVAFSQNDSRYDSGLNLPFNEKAGDVNPQTGNITLSFTDVALPGRAGMNFTFSRIWALNQSNVFAMERNSIDGSNYLSSETIEQYNHIGAGWSASLPYVFESSNGTTNLFFGGNVYELDTSTLPVDNPNNSNILGYDLKDLRVYSGTPGSAITYGNFGSPIPEGYSITDQSTDRSEYVLILKDNSKFYFRPDGRVMMQQDRIGLNRIWYFYNEYQAGKNRLVLVVDTIGREIEFTYNTDGNLSDIAWQVTVGKKDTNDVRTYASEARNVHYSYVNAEIVFGDIDALAGLVVNKKTPYALTEFTDVEGKVTKYDYDAGRAGFSFNSAVSSHENVFLMLTDITSVYTASGFKNKRSFEYAIPDTGLYTKIFWQGYMEYYKISRQYLTDRHAPPDRQGRIMNDTSYIYYEPGYQGNYNQYATVIRTGNVTSTYRYSLSSNRSQDNVLDTLTTQTSDGFLQMTDFVYTNERTKKLDEVYRKGQWVYTEKYDYDTKGNLKRREYRNGLVATWQYDPIYSIPVEEVKTLHVDGIITNYKTTGTVNSIGQVTDQYIYLKDYTQPVHAAHIDYDSFGNVVAHTDAKNNVVHTVYDTAYNAFPVKTWQNVTIDSWSGNPISETNWMTPPNGTSSKLIRTWKIFNTDGTVWMEVDNEGYAIEHYYDKYGREIETVNPNGNDIHNNLETADYSDLYVQYFSNGSNFATYFSSRTDNPGARIEITDQSDFVKTFADIDKSVSSIKITAKQGDGLGHVEEEIEYNGTETYVKKMTYDTLGRMIGLTDPDAITYITDVSVHGTNVMKYDKTWIVYYDDLGRQKRVLYPETAVGRTDLKEMTYDDLANMVLTRDPEGRKVIEKRDWSGNLVSVKALGTSSTLETEQQTYSYAYDELNRKISFTDPKGIVTKYSYDERNLLLKQIYTTSPQDANSDLMEYNELGQLVKKTDRKGQVLVFEYDEIGRNTKVTHFKTKSDYSNYLVPPAGHTSAEYVDHEVGTVYDFRGNAVRIDNQNLIEYYEYDYANRVTKLSRRLKDQAIRTTVASVWGGEENTQAFSFGYEYNDAGMVKQMKYPDNINHDFTYDPVLGRLDSISENGSEFVNEFDYLPSGVVERMEYDNGTVQEWKFDNRKRISNIKVSSATETIEDLNYMINGSGDILAINDNEYTYDAFDRINYAKTLIPGGVDVSKLITASFGTTEFKEPIEVEGEIRSYNKKADLNLDGRINGADHAEASFLDPSLVYDIESFTYDKNGNRTTLVQNGDMYRYDYTGGIENRLMKVWKKKKGATVEKPFAEYTYDENGNTKNRKIYTDTGAIKEIAFTYDTMNRLVKTIEGAKVCEYFYDNAGNRFIKIDADGTMVYLRHGQIAVAMDIEVNAVPASVKGKINRYVLSGDLLAGRVTKTVPDTGDPTIEKSWYHLDHLNSTKCVTNVSATVEVKYVYRAFGEQLKRLDATGADTTDKAKYSYGGKELDDETNLYYFNARYYDATIGRFINVDPIQDGSNWYVYCRNNPLSMKDPTGLDSKDGINKAIETMPKGTSVQIIHTSYNTYTFSTRDSLAEFGRMVTKSANTKVQDMPDIDYNGMVNFLIERALGEFGDLYDMATSFTIPNNMELKAEMGILDSISKYTSDEPFRKKMNEGTKIVFHETVVAILNIQTSSIDGRQLLGSGVSFIYQYDAQVVNTDGSAETIFSKRIDPCGARLFGISWAAYNSLGVLLNKYADAKITHSEQDQQTLYGPSPYRSGFPY